MATLYINKENLKKNIKNIREKLNENVKIIAMVKANAYGMGDVNIAKILEEENIDFFGVALVKEAKHLRENGIKSKILVTSQFLEENIEDIIKYDITVSLSDINLAKKLNEEAIKFNKNVKVHIKLDTGMTRLGVSKDDICTFVKYIKDNYTNLDVEGIYTHLSCADSDDEYTKKQIEIFETSIDNLKDKNITFKYIHMLNSAATIKNDKYSKYQHTHVRVGDILYGYYPDKNVKEYIKLYEIATLKAKILQIRDIEKDSYISYGNTFKAKKGQRIATIQIGYADGLKRKLSNDHFVYYKNNKCNIVGKICMDMCMIDITDVNSPNVGEEVEIFGDNISVDCIAQKLDTINYEIISTVSSRVDRIYIN